jgi:hypothetical protein
VKEELVEYHLRKWRYQLGVVFSLSIVLSLFLVACGNEEPTPILVYITTTPEGNTSVEDTVDLPTATETMLNEVPDDEQSAPTIGTTVADNSNVEQATATTERVEISQDTDDTDSFPLESATPTNTETPTTTTTPTQETTAIATLESTATTTPLPTEFVPPTITPVPPTNTPEAPSFPNIPSAEQLPVLDRSRMGLQLHPFIEQTDWDHLLGQTNQLGFGWVKIQLSWSQLEPNPGQFSPRFYDYVQRVQHANFAQLRILLSVVNAPEWARPTDVPDGTVGPPADPAALGRFLDAFIRETKPEDNRIGAIEIWNEPNLLREWHGAALDGGTYMTYFAAAYDAIKAVAPNITIVTAGLAPVGDGLPESVGDRTFLRQMYAAGLAQYSDVKIGVHPYAWGNSPDERCCTDVRGWANNRVFFFQDTLYDYLSIMQENGHNVQMWITEFGWGTYQGVGEGGSDVGQLPRDAAFFALINPTQQAEYTLRAFELIQQPPLSDVVERAFLWNLNFATRDTVNNALEQAGYSILDASGYGRPIYYYLLVSRRLPEP